MGPAHGILPSSFTGRMSVEVIIAGEREGAMVSENNYGSLFIFVDLTQR